MLPCCCIPDSLLFDIQREHVLRKLNFDTTHRVEGAGGGGGKRGLLAKYLLVCCCICDLLKFDMQHDHVLKMLKFDLLTPPPGSWGWENCGGCLPAKIVTMLMLL